MFSANENLALRQHKKRVVKYVEECIPEEALDAGTSVMVMQVSCKTPGCVPLETVIVICFPRPFHALSQGMVPAEDQVELVPGLPESKVGGNYKTKVLLPLSEVSKEDVCDALPPCFIGGTRTLEKVCRRIRDVGIGQITQNMGEEDVEGRRLMAEYLIMSLQQYLKNGCAPPPIGEDFPPLVNPAVKDEPMTNVEDADTNIEGKNSMIDLHILFE